MEFDGKFPLNNNKHINKMALSNNKKNYENNPLVFLTPRSKDKKGNKVSPYFEVARIDKDKQISKTDETPTQVSGNLLRPRFKTTQYNGQEVKHVVLYITDDKAKETYHIDFTYRIATRSLFNAIISLTNPKGISLSIYESKSGYEAMSLWQNDQLVPWKFGKDELPKSIVVKFKGKDQHDFTPVDDFYETKLKEWADKVFGEESVDETPAPAAAAPTAEAPASNETKKDEDVPF